jgi:hypothetical protein
MDKPVNQNEVILYVRNLTYKITFFSWKLLIQSDEMLNSF